MALIDDFKTRFPEFDTGDVDTAWAGLEASWPCFYGAEYGSDACTDEVILNLIAHLFKVDQGAGPALTASSNSVGSVSATKVVSANMSTRQSYLSSTKYGQRFVMMTQHRHGAHFV